VFLASKLAKYFLGREGSLPLVDAMAATLRSHDFQLKPALTLLFTSAEFYAPEIVGSRIQSPIELVVTTVRNLGLPLEAVAVAMRLFPAMGQIPFQPPTVKGWDEGEAWINASTLLARHNLLKDLVDTGRAFERQNNAQTLRQEQLARHIRQTGPLWSPERMARLPLMLELEQTAGPAEAASLICKRLLCIPLDAKRMGDLTQLLTQQPWQPHSQQFKERIARAVLLVTTTPQYQLN
jgi:hypothetical protein